jgi:asparagine synthase (glutamine-hydrolysing)
MTKVDGGAMRYAVEARSPFLDHLLWEFAATLPYDLRLRNGSLKAVLRELARRRIGARVADGAKKGFGIPVGRWMAGRWGAAFEAVMRDSVLAREGLIDAERVVRTRRQYAERGFVPNQLWYLFVLETWFRRLDRVALAERPVAHAHGSAA